MNIAHQLKLEEMGQSDTDQVVGIIARSMNENEGVWAKQTIDFHFFCKNNKADDGRKYFIARKGDKIIGITGIHIYSWGPQDTAWLGWFAVSPEFHGQKIGYQLMTQTIERAKKSSFRQLLIETYSDQDFAKARTFYAKFGFKVVGNISDYIKKGIDMVVYGLEL